MLYLGITMKQFSMNIVALSSQYRILGEEHFERSEYNSRIQPWIKRFRIADEKVNWFFDEFEFLLPEYEIPFLRELEEWNRIYLVNHRKLNDTFRLIFDYSLFVRDKTIFGTDKPVQVNKAFFLAATERLFPRKYIQYFDLEFDVLPVSRYRVSAAKQYAMRK